MSLAGTYILLLASLLLMLLMTMCSTEDEARANLQNMLARVEFLQVEKGCILGNITNYHLLVSAEKTDILCCLNKKRTCSTSVVTSVANEMFSATFKSPHFRY